MNTIFSVAAGIAVVMIACIAILLALTVLEEVEKFSRRFPRMRRPKR